jgi:hypothetical protein
MPLSKMKSSTIITTIVAVLVGLVLVLINFPFVHSPWVSMLLEPCPVDERWDFRVPGDGRYMVYYHVEDCGAFLEGVFAERSRFPWPWPDEKSIFLYQPSVPYRSIDVIPTGPNSVTISARELIQVFQAETSWGTLKIDYNIGTINEPRPTDPVVTGAAWAEKQQRLEQHARSQGIQLIGSDSPK